MSKIEILAPVGSEEMLHAAVFSGADAVYLGFSGFNARTSAGNFDADSLKEAVRFCHVRGVKVHVALNTTVYGTELAQLADAVRAVAASGADAVICQDLAVAKLIGEIAPELPRHGSTQMSVHTLQGALELKDLGFTRVVLARELSLPEVEAITRNCGIETECFVHGALCMCVSGQCYMSAFLGGRSGNRGSCAGPCRLPFEANPLPEGRPGRLHHLSLKDNSVIDVMDVLRATCRRPDPSLTYPNNLYGYGEIDAYRGLLYLLGIDGIADRSHQQPTRATFSIDAQGSVTVHLAAPASRPFSIQVYSTAGQRLATPQFATGQCQYTFSLAHLPHGIYALQLNGGNDGFTGSTLVRR